MRAITVAWALAVAASAQVPDTMNEFVPSNLPVYVNGQRLDPRDGGHRAAVSREGGLTIDGVLYLPLWTASAYVPAVRPDGMHYASEGSQLAATAVLDAGGSREAARQAMIDFWRREFGDSLTVVPRGPWEFDLTFRGQTLSGVTVTREGYRPEKWMKDNFPVLQSNYRETIKYLKKGYLLVCGEGYFLRVKPGDAATAKNSLSRVAARAKPAYVVGGRTIYETQYLVDERYGLTTSAVEDFVEHGRKER